MKKITTLNLEITEFVTRCTLVTLFMVSGILPAHAGVDPLLGTTWGQGGAYQNATPTQNGELTYPGCTTIASAQILYYYQ
ncbi:MAG: hypothetical protein HOK97_13465, partial [Deltaproteobacteria bacterium]|nr:hypothetical protein [Deltaproteobacteria bacterium]